MTGRKRPVEVEYITSPNGRGSGEGEGDEKRRRAE